MSLLLLRMGRVDILKTLKLWSQILGMIQHLKLILRDLVMDLGVGLELVNFVILSFSYAGKIITNQCNDWSGLNSFNLSFKTG